MTKTETTKILTYIMADFDVEITEAKRDVWHDQFKNVPYELAFEAARLLLKNKSFGAPRVADFAEAIRSISRATGTTLDEGQAFNLALQAVSRFGYVNEAGALSWLSRINQDVAAAVLEFGYQLLCTAETKDLNITRAQFGRVYAAALQRSRTTRATMQAPQISNLVKQLAEDKQNA